MGDAGRKMNTSVPKYGQYFCEHTSKIGVLTPDNGY